jgi:N-acetylglucosamine kinase-like BadF-type ATPase
MSKTLQKIMVPLPGVLEDLGASNPNIYVWISAAGYTEHTRSNMMNAMNTALSEFVQIRAIGAANDGISALLGERADGIVIAGTGSTAIVHSKAGDMAQAGGHEWVACDKGSGFWIGLTAIRKAYDDFADRKDSVLLQRFRQAYSVPDDSDRLFISKLRELAIANADMKKKIAQFARDVCEAAARGDTAAQNIVKQNAEELADEFATLIRRQSSRSNLDTGIVIVEVGGLFFSEMYRLFFQSQLDLRLKGEKGEQAVITWRRVITAAEACIQLAKDLDEGKDDFIKLDLAFRPAVIRR